MLPCVFLLQAICLAQDGPLDRLRVEDEAIAQEAVRGLVERGDASIPELRAALKDPDPRFRRRVRAALGRITGQWGSEGDLVWERAFDKARNRGKPIVVLQLFGKFDEEFC
jgi:hypothetical protein